MSVIVKGEDVKLGPKIGRLETAAKRFISLINEKQIEIPSWFDDKKKAEFAARFPKKPQQTPEASSFGDKPLVQINIANGLAAAAHVAFMDHYPLTLSPDAVWITLTQGLAAHINENAEKLRKKFVAHEGKKIIRIFRDSFVKGDPDNDWAGCFDEFSGKIKTEIGENNHASIVADFSTTGALERAVSEIVLMDSMKSYFDYRVHTCCGIPEFRIEGTRDDWARIIERVKGWNKIDPELETWTGPACRFVQNFVDAFDGKENPDFWRDFYKYESSWGSGGPTVSGWIFHLFPYLSGSGGKLIPNWNLSEQPKEIRGEDDDFPASLSKVPFIWEYYGQELKYDFIGGLVGVEQAEDLSVKPVFGWAVAEQTKEAT